MFLTLITFVLILGLLVFVHELGHFVTARRAGVKVDEFGFGLPPRAFGFYRDPESKRWKAAGPTTVTSSTVYSLNWVPLGGFVKIKGEQGENPDDTDSFIHQSIGKRVVILSAGVLMNIVLALVLLTIGFMIGLPREIDETTDIRFAKVTEPTIYVTQVVDDYPAQKAGIKIGDSIMEVDGQSFKDIPELQKYISAKNGEPVTLTLARGKDTRTVTLIPQVKTETQEVLMGVLLAKMGIVSYPVHLAFWEGIKATLFLTKEIIVAFYLLLKNFIVSQSVVVDLSGPVGIAIITGEVARLGFIYILQFTALLSINLAIINFLPFPALDGGRVLFLVIEKIRGKAINARVEAIIHNIGLYLLFLLVIVITFNDVRRFSDKFSGLWSKLTNLF